MYDSGTVVTSSPQVLHDYCFLIVALEAVNMRWLTSSSLKRLLVLYTCFQASGLVRASPISGEYVSQWTLIRNQGNQP